MQYHSVINPRDIIDDGMSENGLAWLHFFGHQAIMWTKAG